MLHQSLNRSASDNMSRDPLVHLKRENWSVMQEEFIKDWPRGIPAFTVLETQRQWHKDGFDYGFKVYCPFGDVSYGMVAVNEKDVFYEIIIQCPTDDTSKLEEALLNTNRVDWNRKITLPFAPSHIIECIKRVIEKFNVDIDLILQSNSYILHRDTPLFENVSLPPSITFDILTTEHAEFVNSRWPHRYPGSTWYFHLLINTKSGYGLFKNDKLVSWVFINEAGTLGHMFTLEKHRRQSYAELLMKLLCNKLLKEGKDVLIFSVKDNEVAYNLYTKIGFQTYDYGISWVYLKPK